MQITVKKAFIKQSEKLPKNYRAKIIEVIDSIKKSETIDNLSFIEKMAGFDGYYKIRIGYLRIGLEVYENEITLLCVLPRGDIYKHFPPK